MAGFEVLLAIILILMLWRIGLPEGYSVAHRR
jgi:hypothetical protein